MEKNLLQTRKFKVIEFILGFFFFFIFVLTNLSISMISWAAVLPNPNTFQAGDLIWPKKPGAYVPYNSQPKGTYEDDSQQWEKEKNHFVNQVRSNSNASESERNFAAKFEKMTFEEFRQEALGEEERSDFVPFGTDFIYSGHVGMVFFENGEPWVVEAVPGGVQSISYKQWLQERIGFNVWHGRFTKPNSEELTKMVDTARQVIGKPYSLWNLNLNDKSSFYCSKLIWFAAFRGINWNIDEGKPDRETWYTPKMLINSHYVKLINNFEPY